MGYKMKEKSEGNKCGGLSKKKRDKNSFFSTMVKNYHSILQDVLRLQL